MLNRNFAIALAVAMVLAVLYGCSSSGGIKNDRDMYKEDAEMLQGSLDTANEEVTQLTADLATANSDKASLQTDLDAANGDKASLQTDLDAANDRVMELDGMLAAANAAVTQLTADLATANDRVMELDGMLAAANSDKATLQTDLDAANGEVTQLTADLATANSDKASLQTDLDAANGEVTQLTADLATANSDKASLQTDLDAANGEVTQLTDDLATANSDKATLQTDLDAANGEVTQLTADLATANGTIDDLTMQLAAATGNASVLGDRNVAYGTAQNARDAAVEAGFKATGAVTTATEKSVQITTLASEVMGDSMVAEGNAQDVLKAEIAVDEAVITAQDARDDAMAARDYLFPDTDPMDTPIDPLAKALKAAIDVAKEQLGIAENLANPNEPEGQALKMALALVNGADPEADDYPTSPAEHGQAVAMAVGGSLMPTDPNDGSGVRVMVSAATANTPPDLSMVMHESTDNHVGMTWKEIVEAGGGITEKRRIANTEADTDEADVALFMNMPVDSLTNPPADDADILEGAEFGGNYMGIDGVVICGSACTVTPSSDEVIGRLIGTWYFYPTNMTWNYVLTAAGDEYEQETTYAKYGYWLSASAQDSDPAKPGVDIDVNVYAIGGEPGTTTMGLALNRDITPEAMTLTDSSATYEGPAWGISLHKELDAQDEVMEGTLKSAKFTATVALRATFGEAPTLGGMITDFDGDAVDPDGEWEVELLRRGIDNGNPTFVNGTTVASDQDGVWTATGFGRDADPDERPMGFFGTFNAHFTDGHAAGAYATRVPEE